MSMDAATGHTRLSILSEHYGLNASLLDEPVVAVDLANAPDESVETFVCCGVYNLLPKHWVIFVCPRCKSYANREAYVKGTELREAPVFNPHECVCGDNPPCEYCFYFPDPIPEKQYET